jgi:hypothetical protein
MGKNLRHHGRELLLGAEGVTGEHFAAVREVAYMHLC